MRDLTILIDALNEFCKAYEKGYFRPLLEADVAGYLYYLLVIQNKGDASQIHLSARIKNKGESKKFPDIVIGSVWARPEQLHAYGEFAQSANASLVMSVEEVLRGIRSEEFKEYSRPYVADIELAVEVKPFLEAFEYNQLRIRAIKAKADVESLAQEVPAKQRLLLLFDEAGFLTKVHRRKYLDEIISLRNKQEQEINIVYIGVGADRKCSWQFLGVAPSHNSKN